MSIFSNPKALLARRLHKISVQTRFLHLSTSLNVPSGITSCSIPKFRPLTDAYHRLNHVHFPGITPFEQGETVQKLVVDLAMRFKRIDLKTQRLRRKAASQGHCLNPYEEKLLLQVNQMRPPPSLLTFEFENIYTGGRQMKVDSNLGLLIAEFELVGSTYYQIERGGKVTWHGPGQLTVYVLLDLLQFSNLLVRCFVDAVLIELVKRLLSKHFPAIELADGGAKYPPGVWIRAPSGSVRKIGSVGCSIQHGITSYGIALNVHPDLKYLNKFEMCGNMNSVATSIFDLTGIQVSVLEVANWYAAELGSILGIESINFVEGQPPQSQQ